MQDFHGAWLPFRSFPPSAPPLSLERLSGALRSLEVWSQAQ